MTPLLQFSHFTLSVVKLHRLILNTDKCAHMNAWHPQPSSKSEPPALDVAVLVHFRTADDTKQSPLVDSSRCPKHHQKPQPAYKSRPTTALSQKKPPCTFSCTTCSWTNSSMCLMLHMASTPEALTLCEFMLALQPVWQQTAAFLPLLTAASDQTALEHLPTQAALLHSCAF